MKSSKTVPLLIIGSLVTLYSCRQPESRDLQRQSYNSLAECTDDWGDSRYCSSNSSGGGVSHGGYYSGPRYYWDRDIGKPVVVLPDGQASPVSGTRLTSNGSVSGRSFHAGTTSVRGGFGSSARGFSLGG